MKEFIELEIRFLLWSMCCGGLLGLFYWMLTVFRKVVPHHRLITGLEDIGYWIFSAFLIFAVILVANDGAVRWFAIGGMIFGMVIISQLLKYLEKGITIIYYKVRKKFPRKVREKENGKRSCKT